MFGASRGTSSLDGVAFAESVGGVKLDSRSWGAEFIVAATGSTVSTVFGIVAVVTAIVFVAVAADAAAIGLKSVLSLGGSTLVVLHFFFGIDAVVVVARFLLCSESELASEL